MSTICEIDNIKPDEVEERYRNKKTITIITKSLDSIFQSKKNLNVSLVKIDVEGFEEYVIKGGSEFIKHNKPKNIIFEINKMVPNQKDNQLLSIIQFLAPIGYKPYIICPWPTREDTYKHFNGHDYLPLNYFDNINYANILMKLM